MPIWSTMDNSELGYCKTRSNPDESKPLGMMVDLDHMNQFRDVAKLKYAYVGQRSRSKVGHA